MEKIRFFKNNEEIIINPKEINFNLDNLTILKENEDNLIILDFLNQKCELKIKKDNIIVEIPVINMNYHKNEESYIFIYSLSTEENTQNKIIIYQ